VLRQCSKIRTLGKIQRHDAAQMKWVSEMKRCLALGDEAYVHVVSFKQRGMHPHPLLVRIAEIGDVDSVQYRVLFYKTAEGWSVQCPVLPGCWSQGETREEARENIKDAISEWLALAAEEDGIDAISEELVTV
jgi:predicted RNase H-like HicB family nuclease